MKEIVNQNKIIYNWNSTGSTLYMENAGVTATVRRGIEYRELEECTVMCMYHKNPT